MESIFNKPLDEEVKDLNGNFAHKTYAISATTNATGEIATDLDIANVNSIIAVRVEDNGNLRHPMITMSLTGKIMVIVSYRDSGNIVPNTAITGSIVYT